MKTIEALITEEVKRTAIEKSERMPLGTYSRLKVSGEVSDIVIQTSSSGIYFFNVPGTILKNISEQLICFMYYTELKNNLIKL